MDREKSDAHPRNVEAGIHPESETMNVNANSQESSVKDGVFSRLQQDLRPVFRAKKKKKIYNLGGLC